MHQKQQHIVTTSIWLHQGLIVDDGVWSALFLAFTFWSASKTTMDFITSPLGFHIQLIDPIYPQQEHPYSSAGILK